eukprot:6490746-Amphidinium_carterae.1
MAEESRKQHVTITSEGLPIQGWKETTLIVGAITMQVCFVVANVQSPLDYQTSTTTTTTTTTTTATSSTTIDQVAEREEAIIDDNIFDNDDEKEDNSTKLHVPETKDNTIAMMGRMNIKLPNTIRRQGPTIQ